MRTAIAMRVLLGCKEDVSHVSDRTFYDVLDTTRAPVIASHSSARTLAHQPRNMTDDMLRALARNGGVVQINFYSAFLDNRYASEWTKTKKERDERRKVLVERWRGDPARLAREKRRLDLEYDAIMPRPSLEAIADHIDHAVKVAGVEHVGLGSDFDGALMPRGMEDVSRLPHLTAELLRRGHREADLRKILGENLLRVMEQVEKVKSEK